MADADRLSGAELAVFQHLLGLSGQALGQALGMPSPDGSFWAVARRTIARWKTLDRDDQPGIPYGVADQVRPLLDEQRRRIKQFSDLAAADGRLTLRRGDPKEVAAAAIAWLMHPELRIDWASDE